MILKKDSRVFVQLGYTDMRKQINGLSALVQEKRSEGPFDGSYYVFCGEDTKSRENTVLGQNRFLLMAKAA